LVSSHLSHDTGTRPMSTLTMTREVDLGLTIVRTPRVRAEACPTCVVPRDTVRRLAVNAVVDTTLPRARRNGTFESRPSKEEEAQRVRDAVCGA